MEGAQVFSCNTNTGFMGRLSKNTDNLYLKVENDKVSGRGYVCNAEGKNGYIDDFQFAISEVGSVNLTEYNGTQALMFSAKVTNLYGAKKAQIALPQLKNMDLVLGLLNRLKKNAENSGDDWQNSTNAPAAATVQSNPTPTPVASIPTPTPQSVLQPKVSPLGQTKSPLGQTQSPLGQSPMSQPVIQVNSRVNDPARTLSADRAPEQALRREVNTLSDGRKGNSEEFQKRMEKLTVLRDCGLLGEKEFNAKKIELVSEFCDLTEFNEKIQKMIILKDCGVLSEKEFEANRTDIIKECCNTDTPDMDEYYQNLQKLSYLELGGVISEEEYARTKVMLVKDCDFNLDDDKETFSRKLKKLPVLKESQMLTNEEYNAKVEALFAMIDVTEDETFDNLVNKLKKWPLLADEQYISMAELKDKQRDMIDKCVDTSWEDLADLEVVTRKMVALKEGEWLGDMEFYAKKDELLRQVDAIEDYPKKLQARMMLPKIGFISEDDYLIWRQRCIDEVFAPCASMVEFKGKANNLMELQKAGVITETEFVDFKSKLMSEL